ncbi:HEPN/Toprim-associated domain-containing protein [Cellulomonas sp. URHE0023]|uniref:HEPN/Toprim-associated domain-containing protein n=1 Tax=Cellulomonas sp. URHE0023 TaxID=1380354 RepID=UPI000483A1DA|nr:HEPN/Toprim-associated domain-containing protein [Cellulomonas sp. URHE0023]
MGTEITLSLNDIDIDWGKNRYWKNHHWLFPPGSLRDVEYRYAGGVTKTKPAFETTLDEAYFRLCHLGYSSHEAKTKFESAVERWNRTAELRLSFDEFRDALTSIDFAALTSADLEPYIWDFRAFVVNLLGAWGTDGSFLEDFIAGLDFALTLRVLADRPESRSLPLRWHYQDLVESGWASLEDLTDIDRQAFIINHTALFGRLQDHAGAATVRAFDRWLTDRGLTQVTNYGRTTSNGGVAHETTTLPTSVRNMIHHPENPHNVLSDDDLRQSVECLLEIARLLPSPLPGLT